MEMSGKSVVLLLEKAEDINFWFLFIRNGHKLVQFTTEVLRCFLIYLV